MRLDKLAVIRSSGRNGRWFVISALMHVVVIGAVILLVHPLRPRRTVSYIDLAPSPDEAAMPAYRGPGGGSPSPQRIARMQPPAKAPSPEAVLGPPVRDSTVREPEIADVGEPDNLPIDTHRQLGPRYGDGRLWVRAGDAAEGKVPARIAVDSVPSHIALVDSALAEKIRTFLDTVPPDSFATRAAPKWTTEIAGKTWGIDGKWIYLGGLKIPTAILALIPIPASAFGSYDARQREASLNAMRRDILEAAQRASNAVEFRKYVKELRERKEIEHQQRIPPGRVPSDSTARDTTKRREPLYP